MNGQEEELIRLRASVDCATVLEKPAAGWALDQAESTRKALKLRCGPGEIVIVNHDGRGWLSVENRYPVRRTKLRSIYSAVNTFL